MKHQMKQDIRYGRMLWLLDEYIELGIPLDFGIRILHLSVPGGENLLYQQPDDLSDGLSTPEGWRIWGGHRLWSAPETDKSCCPDNLPVSFQIEADGVTLTQQIDPWLQQRKSLRIRFCRGGVHLEHWIENAGSEAVTLASWGVTTFSGGAAELWFDGCTKEFVTPERVLSLWGDTDLSDPRLRLTKDRIFGRFGGTEPLKIGIYSHSGKAVLHHKDQRLTMTFESDSTLPFPDGGCNLELYTDANVFELEALGHVCSLAPGETASHWEHWVVEADRKDGKE